MYGAAIMNAQTGITKEIAQLVTRCHQRDAMIRTRTIGPCRQIGQETFCAADLPGNDDVNNFQYR